MEMTYATLRPGHKMPQLLEVKNSAKEETHNGRGLGP